MIDIALSVIVPAAVMIALGAGDVTGKLPLELMRELDEIAKNQA